MVALILVMTGMGASRCSNAVKPDISTVLAAEANDATVIIEGCGSQPMTGYGYCRMREGDPTVGEILVSVPPVDCAAETCAQVTVFFPDGSPSVAYQVPKGQTKIAVKWSELTKGSVFEKNHRGFWPILMRWKWIGPDKREYESLAEGEVRLRVLARDYLPLHELHEDENFVWKWTVMPDHFRMSTAGRASVWR